MESLGDYFKRVGFKPGEYVIKDKVSELKAMNDWLNKQAERPVISQDDILNLRIDLGRTKTVEEFLATI